ncbi:uncharacterized protein F5147DRAFT_75081 [Suillus discolor]|uniref:Uncharacterized protein n=1 Tax=Suillus discolor TaxID=1912936 RepID=A0A9P7JWQ6_9AGAM|nr:uncharacterized protein F5147DRAFT_75081 [Suillus discolor]KAG2112697.1 hypothetical protein F5147DRAFT_75081 [Suillus discolor]
MARLKYFPLSPVVLTTLAWPPSLTPRTLSLATRDNKHSLFLRRHQGHLARTLKWLYGTRMLYNIPHGHGILSIGLSMCVSFGTEFCSSNNQWSLVLFRLYVIHLRHRPVEVPPRCEFLQIPTND